MIHVADINKVTGYIRGGRPVGHESSSSPSTMKATWPSPPSWSPAGRIGTQVECAPADLIKVTRGKTAAITQEHQT